MEQSSKKFSHIQDLKDGAVYLFKLPNQIKDIFHEKDSLDRSDTNEIGEAIVNTETGEILFKFKRPKTISDSVKNVSQGMNKRPPLEFKLKDSEEHEMYQYLMKS